MRELRPGRLEALHELAYLRVFTTWGGFVEEVVHSHDLRLCLQHLHPSVPTGNSKTATVTSAKAALLRFEEVPPMAQPAVLD